MIRIIDPSTRMVRAAGLALIAGGVFVAATFAASEPARAAEPTPAILLVANPKMHSPLWGRTVLIAAPAPNGGHLGLILNRPTDATLGSLFPQHAASQNVAGRVYFGGPFQVQTLFALVREEDRPSGPGMQTLRLGDELFLAVELHTVDRIIANSADRARYYFGVVVWRPGELREELQHGLWAVREADVDTVLRDDMDHLWHELSHNERVVLAPAR